jgi:hypothetical protein
LPKIDIQSAAPWGWMLFLLLFLLGIVLFYKRSLANLPPSIARWIVFLRGTVLLVIILLILDIKVKLYQRVLLPPRIGIFIDNSLSMANHPSASPSTVYSKATAIVEWADDHNYDPQVITFGEQLNAQPNPSFEYLPDERITNFDLLEEVWQTGNYNAAFLFSDGIATSGKDPSTLADKAGLPVYTVGIGDTTVGMDLEIVELNYPLSLLNLEQSQVEIVARGLNASGRRARLFLFHEDELIYSRQVNFESRDHLEKFEAPVVGRIDAPNFRVELTVLPDEANIDNNRREFRLDVIPGRRRVSMISGALNPNTPLIKGIVKSTPQTTFAQLYYAAGAWRGDERQFWENKHDLVVLDNFPSSSISQADLERLLDKLSNDHTPVIFVAGPDNSGPQFEAFMRNLGISVVRSKTPAATRHQLQSLRVAKLAGAITRLPTQSDLPPVQIEYVLSSGRSSGMQPVIQNERREVIAAIGKSRGERRAAVLIPAAAELHLTLGRTEWQGWLSGILKGMVNFELQPEDFTPYVVHSGRRNYNLGERVALRGIIRDRAGTKLLQPILTVELAGGQSDDLVSLNYNFDSGEYEGDYWPGEPGHYNINIYDDQAASRRPISTGSFNVRTGRVELEKLSVNRYGLARLAELSGGEYLSLSQIESKIENLAYVARLSNTEYQLNIWQLRGLWIVLIFLLGLEWIIRRYVGLI